MEVKEMEALASLLLSPAATLVMAVWMYFSIKKLAEEIDNLKRVIHENGFIKKADMADAWKVADEIHKRHDEDIDRLDREVLRLREKHG